VSEGALQDKIGLVWMDGAMVPLEQANVSVLSHTLHYGTGVFEGIRAYETARGVGIFRLAEHVRRMFQSAHILQIVMPCTEEETAAAVRKVVRENGLGACYIRPIVHLDGDSLGLHARALKAHLSIAAWKWGSYLGEKNLENGISMGTSSFSRHHVNVSMCRGKITGHYVNSVLAVHMAHSDGYDEALLLDVDGFVAEGAGENVFIVREGRIYTPELTSALDGITRKTVLRLAEMAGYQVTFCRLTRDDVYLADEAFLVGTAAEVTPVRELDRRAIGGGGRGPVTADLQQRYFECVKGETPELEDWISLVDGD
jgi:branched-chain amino acid aminotransferase